MTCQAGSSRGVCLGRGGRLALECEEAALEELEDLIDDLHRALVVALVGLGLESIACRLERRDQGRADILGVGTEVDGDRCREHGLRVRRGGLAS